MIKFLQKLFIGHFHEWEVFEKFNIINLDYDYPIGYKVIMKCKHCGKMKTFKLKG